MINKPRGTNDIYGSEMELLTTVLQTSRSILSKANYQEIATPMFEAKELFVRSVGETSDVVNKEMYEFSDKKNRLFVLRPEGTAGVVRAVVENKLYSLNNLPLKFFYVGSMFRYERPQAGRSRQFNQLGIESFGADSLNQDLEVISLGMEILQALNLAKKATIYLNYLVSGEQQRPYLAELTKYFTTFDDLCQDCQVRIKKNPLRALDCKIDHAKFTNPPKMVDFLAPEAKTRFEDLEKSLVALGYQVKIDPNLVRGLDYYTGMVFEIKYEDQQTKDDGLTIIGGGRYNNLVAELGGPEIPAAGFGLGLERLLDLIAHQERNLPINHHLDLYVIALEFSPTVMKLVWNLREAGLIVDFSLLNNSLKTGFKEATKYQAQEVMVLGAKELASNKAMLKNQTTGQEVPVDLNEIEKIKAIIREQK